MTVANNKAKKRSVGMIQWFSIDGWRTVSVIAQIATWTFGGLGILSGIILYQSNNFVKGLEKGPRTLSTNKTPANSPSAFSQQSYYQPSVLVVSIGGKEVIDYADQIAKALNSMVHIERFGIGFTPSLEPGLTTFANGNDIQPLLNHLTEMGLKTNPSHMSFLPLPSRVRQQYKDFVVLIVGPKP
jgi:hypothetical protein